jgi:GYF domain 2
MYRIIGADGNQYGPISADQLRQWIAEGRANAQTKVLAEGTTDWKPLSEFPEFFPSTTAPGATPLPPSPTPGIPTMQPLGGYGFPGAADQVTGPAIGLMVVAILGFLGQAFGLVWRLFFSAIAAAQSNQPEWVTYFQGTAGIVSSILGILSSILVLFGALKMKKLESHGLAMAVSIIAMIPCVSPCCLIGIPIGIWSLVMLSKPEVKSAFH